MSSRDTINRLLPLIQRECPLHILGELHTSPNQRYRHYIFSGEDIIRCCSISGDTICRIPGGSKITELQGFIEMISPNGNRSVLSYKGDSVPNSGDDE